MMRSYKTVLVLDFLCFYNTEIIDSVFTDHGIRVVRPKSRRELLSALKLDSQSWITKPDAVLLFNRSEELLPWLLTFLRVVEEYGVPILNSPANICLFSNHALRNSILRKLDVMVPDFFFGLPTDIPEWLGETVVWKSSATHHVVSCSRSSVCSLEDPVYVERLIPNPDKRVLTVYNVAGCLYARWKEDVLRTKRVTRERVRNSDQFKHQFAIARRITEHFDLAFSNVEFIGDYVVDVNTIANFFYEDHLEPIESLACYVSRLG